MSPHDQDGHGTHTASIAVGSPVFNASFFGYATGTTRGMATHARVAMYKAIKDGVDILSLLIGGGPAPYFQDPIAIGAFTMVEKGIFVSCSAGNSGPKLATIVNGAPWVMIVGAGTLDHDFPAYVSLGNKNRFTGVSLYGGQGMWNKKIGLCIPGSLERDLVRGKAVVCNIGMNSRVEKGELVRDAGGVRMILANVAANDKGLVADSHLLPTVEVGCKAGNLIKKYLRHTAMAVAVGRKAGDLIKEYVRSNPNPTALLSFGGTLLDVRPSPVVTMFSSWGPNMVTSQIVKPDTTPNPLSEVTGGALSNPWAHRAGHVDPHEALSPGLLYDISTEDYITLLCSLDYTINQVETIVKCSNVTCSTKFSNPGELNYPSFSVFFENNGVF
ncbi:subtilisin-like protease sbt1.8 [Quercus suber]|uniref:Subtilisin-like protease sbt1.8 n=1 Tax=Quercus suber TaxID=58331 RepID=A0AAW0LK37_QUESU